MNATECVLVFIDGTREHAWRIEDVGVLGEQQPDGTWTPRKVVRDYRRDDGEMWFRFVDRDLWDQHNRMIFTIDAAPDGR